MIYADNAATTALSPRAAAAMAPCRGELYANPSSPHILGQRAKAALEGARQTIARCLGCEAREIYFTSGGTEADNQAILSAALAGAAQGKRHIVTTAFEHHAVLNPLARLEAEGFTITRLEVSCGHNLRSEQVAQALRPDTCLVSAMYANNEIGSVLPIAEIGAICRRAGVPFHTDAVQAAGHIPIDVRAAGADMLSLSGHKFHGPKGIGALYVRRGAPISSLLLGGAQERGRRAGTENLPGALGMAAALEEAAENLEANAAHVSALRDRLLEGLAEIPGALVNGDRAHALPGIVNLCFEDVSGENLLLLLEQEGILCSSGAACAAGAMEPSHVLLAIGRTPEQARGALRLSLSEYNTPAEAEAILRAVPRAVARARGIGMA